MAGFAVHGIHACHACFGTAARSRSSNSTGVPAVPPSGGTAGVPGGHHDLGVPWAGVVKCVIAEFRLLDLEKGRSIVKLFVLHIYHILAFGTRRPLK